MIIAYIMNCSSKLFWSNSNNQYSKNFLADKSKELLAKYITTLQQCKIMTERSLLHFDKNFECSLKLPGVQNIDMIRRVPIFLNSACLFVWSKLSALHLSTHTQADALFWFFFASHSSGWATTSARLPYAVGIRRKMSFSRTWWRTVNAGIEPGVSNFSITCPTLCQWAIVYAKFRFQFKLNLLN